MLKSLLTLAVSSALYLASAPAWAGAPSCAPPKDPVARSLVKIAQEGLLAPAASGLPAMALETLVGVRGRCAGAEIGAALSSSDPMLRGTAARLAAEHGLFEARARAAAKIELAPKPAPAPVKPWTCAMHPEVHQDHAGPCPICAMDMIPSQPQPQPNPFARVDAAAALAHLRDPAGVKALVALSRRQPASSSGWSAVGSMAAFRLYEVATTKDRARVKAALAAKPEPEVVIFLRAAAARLGDAAARRALAAQARSGDSLAIALLGSLIRASDSKSLALLRELAGSSGDLPARRAAAAALARLGHGGALDHLIATHLPGIARLNPEALSWIRAVAEARKPALLAPFLRLLPPAPPDIRLAAASMMAVAYRALPGEHRD